MATAVLTQNPPAREVTFSKDVAPILFENCVYCHRPGDIAPFSMLTFASVRPWARSIRQEVLARRMPPWFVDAQHQSFLNGRRLSDDDVLAIVEWVDGGAKEGARGDLPPFPKFENGWQIGTPDLVLTAPAYTLPATGVIPAVTLATGYAFPEDAWVQAIEIRPGNRRVVHQALAVLGHGGAANGLALYSAGLDAVRLRDGYGKFIPKGASIELEMHYNTVGQAITDQSQIALKFATRPVHTEVRTGVSESSGFKAPTLQQSHEIAVTFPLASRARIHSFRAHMYVRGKNASVTLVSADGSRQALLSLGGWTDYWQHEYVFTKPVEVPPGAYVEYAASYDAPPSAKDAHLLTFDWSEVNAQNRSDLDAVRIVSDKRFTTGVMAR